MDWFICSAYECDATSECADGWTRQNDGRHLCPKHSGAEFTGGPVSYYTIDVCNPVSIDMPYRAECVDIIEALHMSFVEGEAFKAIWRMCAARKLGVKKRGQSDLYDAEKVQFYGSRMVAVAKSMPDEILKEAGIWVCTGCGATTDNPSPWEAREASELLCIDCQAMGS